MNFLKWWLKFVTLALALIVGLLYFGLKGLNYGETAVGNCKVAFAVLALVTAFLVAYGPRKPREKMAKKNDPRFVGGGLGTRNIGG